MKIALVILGCILFLFCMTRLPLPIPFTLDFDVIYLADMALLHGISIYNHAGPVDLIARLVNVSPDLVFVLPFPYPPWYALATLWMALLPISVAVRVWFGLNMLMSFVSTWLMTGGWERRRRLAVFFFAIFFLPVLGTLWIGQFSLPVLLGTALLIYALGHDQPVLIALAAALLTFKPHLGVLILLIGLIYLFLRRDDFGRRALISILAVGIFLFLIGFLASPLWPVDYFHSLAGFKEVSQCHQCNNVPMILTGLLGMGFDQAVWLALGILAFMGILIVSKWKALTRDPRWLAGASASVALLVNPYLQNYDYVLLLVPLFILAGAARRLDWLWLAVAYLLPLIGVGFFGTRGEISLVLSALITFILFMSVIPKLDVSTHAAYNPATMK